MSDDEQKFTWGDTVVVHASAPSPMRPGAVGEVVGFTRKSDETTYTVEFGDGRDVQVPQSLLSGDIPGHTEGAECSVTGSGYGRLRVSWHVTVGLN